jgi:hypothetical protein
VQKRDADQETRDDHGANFRDMHAGNGLFRRRIPSAARSAHRRFRWCADGARRSLRFTKEAHYDRDCFQSNKPESAQR